MPRIFLPAVTPRNNALLSGHTQEAFALEGSDEESTTDEESPDLLAPNQRPQQPQRQRVEVGRSTAVTTTLAASHKRACVPGSGQNGAPPKRPRQQKELYSVVFMTVALGITLADDGDEDGSLVVADKGTTAMANAASEISVGDRLHAVGGTSAAGLSVDSVQRLIIRGSRPLEIVFRRRSSSGCDGTIAAANAKAASAQKRKHRPLGGLEQPSRDCLLDMISNIATQEDSLPDSQTQETQAGLMTRASSPDRDENGGVCSPSQSLVSLVFSPSTGKASTPAAAPAGAAPAAAATPSNGGERPSEDGDETCLQHQPIVRRRGPGPSAWAPASPSSSSSSSSSTEVDLLPPATNSAHPQDARKVADTVRSADAPETLGVAERTKTTSFAQAPSLAPSGGGGAADISKKSTRCSKKTKRKGGGGSSSGKGRGLRNSNTHKNNSNDNNNCELSRVPALNSGGGGGGGGSTKQATAEASLSSAQVPAAAEVERILSKLGPKGVSELALYKNLSFDELVRVCRYTRGIDLSKRLPKATMAELLNSLCVEEGALAVELQNARTHAGRGEGSRRGVGGGGPLGSARGDGRLNGGARTPARPSTTTSALLSGTLPRTAPAPLFESWSPPSSQSFPRKGGRPGPPSSGVSSALFPLPRPPPPPPGYSSTAGATMTPLQHRERQRLPPAGSREAPTVAGPAPETMFRGEDHDRGGENGRRERDEEDDRHCWEDWDYQDNAGGGDGRVGVRIVRNERHGGEGGRAGGVPNLEDVDEEAAWWSREPDHEDWSPCSSPTAALVFPPRVQGGPSRGASSSSPAPSLVGASGGDQEEEQQQEEPRRRNPLLPALSFTGRASVSGARFTALPKWILRSVRTIGTQTPRG